MLPDQMFPESADSEGAKPMEKFRVLTKGIVRHNDKYLVVERWYDDRIFDPYQWEFINGYVNFGETPEIALKRSILEQTGLTVEVTKTLYTWGFTAGEVCSSGIAFLCDAVSDNVRLSEDLHDSKWIDKDEILTTLSNKNVVEDIKNSGFIEDFAIDDFGEIDLFIDPVKED